jgi:hypothetical protein
VDPTWGHKLNQSGLVSGEGLIHHVRDPREQLIRNPKTGESRMELADTGVADKRLLVIEQEFAVVLQVMGRESNTLSEILRLAWDGTTLQVLAKTCGERATDGHVSLLGNIVREELTKLLPLTQVFNGFGNRFLWFVARRARCLPHGGGPIDYDSLAARLGAILEQPVVRARVTWEPRASEVWAAVYPQLSDELTGLFGAITGRAEAMVLRLSVLYARLDAAPAIQLPHLFAAR